MREQSNVDLAVRLKAMSAKGFEDIDPSELKDVSQIRIDSSRPVQQRLESLIEQSGNPYFFRDGDIVVKLSYANRGKSLQSCMEEYLASQIGRRKQNC